VELYLHASNMSRRHGAYAQINFVLMAISDTVVGFSGSGENVPFYRSARPDLPTGIHHFTML
jgi:hypothetical protein